MKIIAVAFILMALTGCVKFAEDKAVAKTAEKQKVLPKMAETFPFSKASRIEVISFDHMDFSADDNSYEIVNGKLPFDENIIKERIVLTEKQRSELFKLLYTDDCAEGGYKYDCYMPEHRIIFYDDDKIIAFLEVCLQCAGSVASKNFETAEFCEAKFNELGHFFKLVGIRHFSEM